MPWLSEHLIRTIIADPRVRQDRSDTTEPKVSRPAMCPPFEAEICAFRADIGDANSLRPPRPPSVALSAGSHRREQAQCRDGVEYLLEQPACDIISAAHLTLVDADRLAHDPIMRAITDRGGLDRRVVLPFGHVFERCFQPCRSKIMFNDRRHPWSNSTASRA